MQLIYDVRLWIELFEIILYRSTAFLHIKSQILHNHKIAFGLRAILFTIFNKCYNFAHGLKINFN